MSYQKDIKTDIQPDKTIISIMCSVFTDLSKINVLEIGCGFNTKSNCSKCFAIKPAISNL